MTRSKTAVKERGRHLIRVFDRVFKTRVEKMSQLSFVSESKGRQERIVSQAHTKRLLHAKLPILHKVYFQGQFLLQDFRLDRPTITI